MFRGVRYVSLFSKKKNIKISTTKQPQPTGLDLSSFYVAGRIRDRNIAILIISTLIFVQRTPKNTTEPLSLQLSEVDSCVWAD